MNETGGMVIIGRCDWSKLLRLDWCTVLTVVPPPTEDGSPEDLFYFSTLLMSNLAGFKLWLLLSLRFLDSLAW
jgi:hypothetical protein